MNYQETNQRETSQRERLRDEEKEKAHKEAIQVYAQYVPEPLIKARVARNFGEMREHRWLFPIERDGAIEAVEAAQAAHELGFRNQVKHHLLKTESHFIFDRANQSIIRARRAGLSLRPFAKLGEEPGKQFEIRGARMRGQDVRWRFSRIEDYEAPIPAQVLRNAKALRDAGFEWDHGYVGEPYVIQVRRVVDWDPILVFVDGRLVLEVGRW